MNRAIVERKVFRRRFVTVDGNGAVRVNRQFERRPAAFQLVAGNAVIRGRDVVRSRHQLRHACVSNLLAKRVVVADGDGHELLRGRGGIGRRFGRRNVGRRHVRCGRRRIRRRFRRGNFRRSLHRMIVESDRIRRNFFAIHVQRAVRIHRQVKLRQGTVQLVTGDFALRNHRIRPRQQFLHHRVGNFHAAHVEVVNRHQHRLRGGRIRRRGGIGRRFGCGGFRLGNIIVEIHLARRRDTAGNVHFHRAFRAGHRHIAVRHALRIRRHKVCPLAQRQRVVHRNRLALGIEVVHGHVHFGRLRVGIEEGHTRQVGRTVRTQRDRLRIFADEVVPAHAVAGGIDVVHALGQRLRLLVQQRAVLVIVEHVDVGCYRLRRGIVEHNGIHARRAAVVHPHMHRILADKLIPSSHRAIGGDIVVALIQRHILRVQNRAVVIQLIQHSHFRLNDGRLGRGFGGHFRRRFGRLLRHGVDKAHLARRRIAHAVHKHIHHAGRRFDKQIIPRHNTGIGVHLGSRVRQAACVLEIQLLAILRHIVHRHVDALLRGRFRHPLRREIQREHPFIDAVAVIIHFIRIHRVKGGRILRPHDFRRIIFQVESIRWVRRYNLHLNRAEKSGRIQRRPIRMFRAVRHGERLRCLLLSLRIRPNDGHDDVLPAIQRQRRNHRGCHQQRRHHQHRQQTAKTFDAGFSHVGFPPCSCPLRA